MEPDKEIVFTLRAINDNLVELVKEMKEIKETLKRVQRNGLHVLRGI